MWPDLSTNLQGRHKLHNSSDGEGLEPGTLANMTLYLSEIGAWRSFWLILTDGISLLSFCGRADDQHPIPIMAWHSMVVAVAVAVAVDVPDVGRRRGQEVEKAAGQSAAREMSARHHDSGVGRAASDEMAPNRTKWARIPRPLTALLTATTVARRRPDLSCSSFIHSSCLGIIRSLSSSGNPKEKDGILTT